MATISTAPEQQREEAGAELRCVSARRGGFSASWRSRLACWLLRLAIRLEAQSIRNEDATAAARLDDAPRGVRKTRTGTRPW
jgi:hypothetical protein